MEMEAQATELIHDLLRGMLSKKASDLFITAGFPPAMKVDGKMTPVIDQALTEAHTRIWRAADERQAGRRVRGDQGVQLRHQPARHRALPRQRASCSSNASGMVLRTINTQIPDLDELGLPPVLKDVVDDQARPGDPGGRHRLGQIDHARGHDRLPQREQLRPHHHHRGSGGVRARAQQLHRHPARGRAWTPSPGTRR